MLLESCKKYLFNRDFKNGIGKRVETSFLSV
jgi:hypothetical protein